MSETPKWASGPWFVSGVRFKMNGGEWHSVNRYNEALKYDENMACVGYDPRDGAGLAEARLIAASPDLYAALMEANGKLQQLLFDGPHHPLIRANAAALAKARGETP